MDEWKETIRELYIGIGICTLIFAAAGGLLVQARAAWISGAALGGAEAALLARHMARRISGTMDMEPKAAAGYIRRGTIFRMLVMILTVLLAVLLPEYFHVVGVIAGILSLKFGALLQPLVHRCRRKMRKER